MPLNTPSNLSLGKLGHIAGGNAGHTNETSLAATCRGSASETAMWDDFKIGTISFDEVTFLEGAGTWEYAHLILSVPSSGDVGDYMGSSSGGSDYYVSKTYNTSSDILHEGDDWTIEIDESGAGSLYVSRIQNRSTNSSDYVFSKEHISGTDHTFSPSNSVSPYDRFVLVTFE
tara:strand:+ start:32 stop:550 length:519 start_codon:yes stop_codon:yes gene_type:complete